MNTTATFSDLIKIFLDLINSIIPLLAGVALVLFFIGAIRYIYRAADAKGKHHDKDMLLWGLIALFVLTSVWGLINFLKESLLP